MLKNVEKNRDRHEIHGKHTAEWEFSTVKRGFPHMFSTTSVKKARFPSCQKAFRGIFFPVFVKIAKQHFMGNRNFQEVFHNIFHTLWKTLPHFSTM